MRWACNGLKEKKLNFAVIARIKNKENEKCVKKRKSNDKIACTYRRSGLLRLRGVLQGDPHTALFGHLHDGDFGGRSL